MEKVRPWCGQPSDRGRLKNRTEQHFFFKMAAVRHLGFVERVLGLPMMSRPYFRFYEYYTSYCRCGKFAWNRCGSPII